jgi:hypothetical protein
MCSRLCYRFCSTWSTALVGLQVGELLLNLLERQDATDGSAVTIPAFRILKRWCRVRVMTLKAMAFSPDVDQSSNHVVLVILLSRR